jgi:DnaJ-class molecular chaperone
VTTRPKNIRTRYLPPAAFTAATQGVTRMPAKCIGCSGTGRIQCVTELVCRACDGDGCKACGASGRVTCTGCNGTGSYQCSTCGGTGETMGTAERERGR